MESILLGIGNCVLGPIVSLMSDRMRLFWDNELVITDIQGDLMRIKNMLSVIMDGFENNRNEDLKNWIVKARKIAYEFADFQDDCELTKMKHEKQLFSCSKYLSQLRDSSKIPSIQRELKIILSSATKKLHLKEPEENVRQAQWRQTTYIPHDDERMIGRDDVKDHVIKMLKSESVEDELNYNVIPIEGMGGIGKTTLAQYVYNDDDIKEYFQLKIWVCVSDDFDEVRLTKEIINTIQSNHLSIDDNWNVLQTKLLELLRGKRFLLVLDDVWNHEEVEKWKNFKKAFRYGQKGSKILVTTRLPMVSKMVSPKNKDHIVLEDLSDNNIRDVFKMHAFQGCDDIDSHLKKIGEDICKKLKGSPLAAKTIGKLLNYYNKLYCNRELITKWEAVSNSELWNADQNDTTDIMPALLLSYQHLPEDLKPCFAFFSLFPKDHVFDAEELIGMWGAHGWIKDESNKTMEDAGKEYLNELLSRSIIQSYKEERIYSKYCFEIQQREKYIMHDLIHDLALLVSKDEYLFVKSESDLQNISSNIIHLSVDSSRCDIGRVQKEKFHNLRTFIEIDQHLYFNYNIGYIEAKKLRVFKARLSKENDLDVITNARYLRYLHLFEISKLPSSFYTLYFLQVLITKKMPKMSKETNRLVNLRRVNVFYGDRHYGSFSKGVSKMRMLRELRFEVSNEIDETIKELKNLNNLEKLSLFHLDQVVSNEDVMECNLMGKRHLHQLTLSWDSCDGGSSSKNVSEYDVFEGLQPPENLRDLKIDNYSGIRSPNWMKNLSLLNLQRIVISECRCWNIEDVPFGHLPNLEYLKIMGMSGVQQLGPKFFGDGDVRGFPSLEYLEFSEMENWEEWRIPSDNLPNTQIFPRLKKLEIYSCPKLKNIPFQIPSIYLENLKSLPSLDLRYHGNLRKLTISNCPMLSVGSTMVVLSQLKNFVIEGVTLCQLKEWLMVLSSNTTTTTSSALQYLEIGGCPELMYFDADMDEALHKLTNLSELQIIRCPNLVSLPENGLPSSLQTLSISCCDNLKSLPENGLPSSLQTLRIFICHNLKPLPENGLPSSLQTLWIFSCHNLKSLPENGLPSSLQYLVISDCNNLKSLPENGLPSSLQTLRISKCDNLKSLPENGLPSSLQNLWIFNCDNLKSLSENGLPSSLQTLRISGCHNLKSLPENGLPSSLQTLRISNCDKVLKERCKEGGADWHKIEHIPHKFVD